MKCLLVEDDPVNMALLKGFLLRMGHEVSAVSSGHEAWVTYVAGRYPIVICDWSLPGMSGLEICQRVRARKSSEYTYFILITAVEGEDKLTEAMNSGVDDFLPKPIDLNTLSIRVRVAERIIAFQSQIGLLKGLLPICMYCKKIRGDKEYWETVETYFTAHTGADFTHSLCPDCYTTHVLPSLMNSEIDPSLGTD